MPPTPPIQTTVMESILFVSFTTATILILLPYEYIDGNPVPTVIFKGLPSIFHAFVISIMFAFSGACNALLIPNKPSIVRFCRYYSLASMASAIALLVWTISMGNSGG
ncbi:hypothetical protein L1049_013651 [Liquidambar formosana]|uniref:Uncharacterized protein n=1 Tax=Liquidambar formosana TaxID=63359 RepID=A0AAP0WUH1_LIQFO